MNESKNMNAIAALEADYRDLREDASRWAGIFQALLAGGSKKAPEALANLEGATAEALHSYRILIQARAAPEEIASPGRTARRLEEDRRMATETREVMRRRMAEEVAGPAASSPAEEGLRKAQAAVDEFADRISLRRRLLDTPYVLRLPALNAPGGPPAAATVLGTRRRSGRIVLMCRWSSSSGLGDRFQVSLEEAIRNLEAGSWTLAEEG